MTSGLSAPRAESREVAALLGELSKRAEATNPLELVMDWQAIERRVFACLRGLEREAASSPRDVAELERLRNLAWEVGISIDIHSVHSRALSTLAEQLARRAARPKREDGRSRLPTSGSFAERRQ